MCKTWNDCNLLKYEKKMLLKLIENRANEKIIKDKDLRKITKQELIQKLILYPVLLYHPHDFITKSHIEVELEIIHNVSLTKQTLSTKALYQLFENQFNSDI